MQGDPKKRDRKHPHIKRAHQYFNTFQQLFSLQSNSYQRAEYSHLPSTEYLHLQGTTRHHAIVLAPQLKIARAPSVFHGIG